MEAHRQHWSGIVAVGEQNTTGYTNEWNDRNTENLLCTQHHCVSYWRML